jgi:hypothetical protein
VLESQPDLVSHYLPVNRRVQSQVALVSLQLLALLQLLVSLNDRESHCGQVSHCDRAKLHPPPPHRFQESLKGLVKPQHHHLLVRLPNHHDWQSQV